MNGRDSTSSSALGGRFLGFISCEDGLRQGPGEAAETEEEEPSVGSFASSICWIISIDLVVISRVGVVGGLQLLADPSADVDMV